MENKFEDSWMCKQTLESDQIKNDPLIQELIQTFFEDMVQHRFTEQRLSWLFHWFGHEEQSEKMTFMIHIWKMSYFNPFATPEETTEIIYKEIEENRLNKYTVSLSSTKPEMFRITFYSKKNNAVVHRRIHIGKFLNQPISDNFYFDEPVKFNMFVLEDQIRKLIKYHSIENPRPIPYVDVSEEKTIAPVPYHSIDD